MEFRLTALDPCEWDPTRDVPATTAQGCPNQADLIVGDDGKWGLCFPCVHPPRFKSLRKRVPITRPLGFVPVE